MPKWLKIVLGVLATLVAICLFSGGAAAWWINANKDRLKADGQRVMAEGGKFGMETDADGCVAEALRRLEAADGFIAQAEQKVFLRACLEHTLVRPDFCAGVPTMSEFMAAATWSVANCNDRHAKDPQACGRMIQAVMEFCEHASAKTDDRHAKDR